MANDHDPKPDKGKDDEHGHSGAGDDLSADLVRLTVPAPEYARYSPDDVAAWAGRDVQVRVDLSACGAPAVNVTARITTVQLPENRKSATMWLAFKPKGDS